MVEDIQKIRIRIGKLLKHIHTLKEELRNEKSAAENREQKKFLDVIHLLDDLDSRILKEGKEGLEEQRILLENLLKSWGVHRLPSPMDKIAEFCQVEGHRPSSDKKEGTVLEVLKSGYTRGDVLIRPTSVIVAKKN